MFELARKMPLELRRILARTTFRDYVSISEANGLMPKLDGYTRFFFGMGQNSFKPAVFYIDYGPDYWLLAHRKALGARTVNILLERVSRRARCLLSHFTEEVRCNEVRVLMHIMGTLVPKKGGAGGAE